MTILTSMKSAIDDFRAGKLDTYLGLLGEDYHVALNGQPTPINREVATMLLKALTKAIPDFDLGVTNLRQVGDDKVVFDTLITGTHLGVMELPGVPPAPPTKRRIQGDPQTATFWFKQGKVVREEIVTPPSSDPMAIYKQLGIEQLPGQ